MVFTPTSCSKQGSPKLGQVAQALDLSVWRTSKDRDLNTSLVSVPDLHHSCGRNVFHMSNQNFPCCSLCPLPLVLSLQTCEKSLSLSLLRNPVRQRITAATHPSTFFFPGWTSPVPFFSTPYCLLSCACPLLHQIILGFCHYFLVQLSPKYLSHHGLLKIWKPKRIASDHLQQESKSPCGSSRENQPSPCHQDQQRSAPEKC